MWHMAIKVGYHIQDIPNHSCIKMMIQIFKQFCSLAFVIFHENMRKYPLIVLGVIIKIDKINGWYLRFEKYW